MTADQFASLRDPEIIEACLKGEPRAWESLLVRYQRLIYSIPLRYGLSEQDANDIFQNVSILLLENLARLRDHERLGAWLTITTRRECWRTFRSRQTVPLPSDSVPGDLLEVAHSEETFLDLEQQSIVRSAVGSMGAPCQQLITLLFYADPRPSYTEVAQTLGLPEGSIGPNRARCLEKLMKILEQMGFSEP